MQNANGTISNNVRALLARLEPTLTAMVGVHESLISLAGEQRLAISSADSRRLADVIGRTQTELRSLTDLEAERQRITAGSGVRPAHGDAQPKAEELAALLPEDEGGRIRSLATHLRDLISRLREEHAAVRAASESLARHARGLIEQVSQRVSHAGTYSPSGRVDAGRTPVVSSVDVSS